jgi:hypothetical protein
VVQFLGETSPIIPIRCGVDPYGFMGKIQGLAGDLKNTKDLTTGIVSVLLKHETLSLKAKETFIQAIEGSESYIASLRLKDCMHYLDGLSGDQLLRLKKASKTNSQISGAYGVSKAIEDVVRTNDATVK